MMETSRKCRCEEEFSLFLFFSRKKNTQIAPGEEVKSREFNDEKEEHEEVLTSSTTDCERTKKTSLDRSIKLNKKNSSSALAISSLRLDDDTQRALLDVVLLLACFGLSRQLSNFFAARSHHQRPTIDSFCSHFTTLNIYEKKISHSNSLTRNNVCFKQIIKKLFIQDFHFHFVICALFFLSFLNAMR